MVTYTGYGPTTTAPSVLDCLFEGIDTVMVILLELQGCLSFCFLPFPSLSFLKPGAIVVEIQ